MHSGRDICTTARDSVHDQAAVAPPLEFTSTKRWSVQVATTTDGAPAHLRDRDRSLTLSDLPELEEDGVQVLALVLAHPPDVDRQPDVGSQQDQAHEAADHLHDAGA